MREDYLKEIKGEEYIVEHKRKKNSKTYSLTEKGYSYLAEYRTVIRFVESFGLEEE